MMTLAEFGLYNWLLDYAWHNESKPCFLENDSKKLARLVGQPLGTYLKAWAGIQKKFELWVDPRTQVEYFYNPRLYTEYSKRLAISEKQTTKANLRWGKTKTPEDAGSDAAADATAYATACAADHAPNSLQSTKNPQSPLAGAEKYSPEFEKFWEAYPKKTEKVEAFKVWKRLRPDEELQRKMIAVIELAKHTEQWRKDGGQFIPNPAKWLRRGNWLDEIPQPKAKAVQVAL